MKASELTEVFNSDVKGQVVRATNDLFTTSAEINNRKIVFNASGFVDANGKNIWEIDFIEKSNSNVTFGKTGSGGELQVFSFVIESINELVSRYQPDEIIFGSHKEDGNRSALYARMAKRIKIPGYKFAGARSDTYTDVFSIVKDK